MSIQSFKFIPTHSSNNSNLCGVATVVYQGEIEIQSIMLREGKDGSIWAALPRNTRKNPDGTVEYFPSVWPCVQTDEEKHQIRESITQLVSETYGEFLANGMKNTRQDCSITYNFANLQNNQALPNPHGLYCSARVVLKGTWGLNLSCYRQYDGNFKVEFPHGNRQKDGKPIYNAKGYPIDATTVRPLNVEDRRELVMKLLDFVIHPEKQPQPVAPTAASAQNEAAPASSQPAAAKGFLFGQPSAPAAPTQFNPVQTEPSFDPSIDDQDLFLDDLSIADDDLPF